MKINMHVNLPITTIMQ